MSLLFLEMTPCSWEFIKDENICEELLFAKTVLTNKIGEAIFRVVETFLNIPEIPLTNILTCATDGEPTMVGCHKGLLSFLKRAVPDIISIHCIINRQHLVAKNLSKECFLICKVFH